MALFGASHVLFGSTAPSTTIQSFNTLPSIAVKASPPRQSSDSSTIGYKEANDNHSLNKKSSHSHSKFRKLAGTKRGKNRILFTQDFQAPDRTVLLANNLDTQIQADPLVFTTIQEFTSLPEELEAIFNENLYTIALRV
jgi:hypothetical protein